MSKVILNLRKLRKLALAATPGPWESTGVVIAAPAEGGMDYLLESYVEDSPNLDYVAAIGPEVLLKLLDLVETLQNNQHPQEP